jgi:hypothetical protein
LLFSSYSYLLFLISSYSSILILVFLSILILLILLVLFFVFLFFFSYILICLLYYRHTNYVPVRPYVLTFVFYNFFCFWTFIFVIFLLFFSVQKTPRKFQFGKKSAKVYHCLYSSTEQLQVALWTYMFLKFGLNNEKCIHTLPLRSVPFHISPSLIPPSPSPLSRLLCQFGYQN